MSSDEAAYGRLAVTLATEQRFGDPRLHQSLHWPPGAPVLFAVGYALHPDNDLRGAYWLQMVVGTLLIGVVFALACAVAGDWAGIVSAALVAFYPPYIQTTGELLSEPLGALLLTSATLAVVLAWRRASWRGFAVSGFLYGLAILTRADFVLMPAVVGALMAIAAGRRRDPRLIVRTAGVFLAATALTLTPWLAYGWHRVGHPVAVTEGDASALYVGTFLPGGGTTNGMKAVLGDETRARFPQVRHVPNANLEAKWVFKLVASRHPGMSQDDALRIEARKNLSRYALGQPAAFAKMMADKVRRTWILSSRVGRQGVSRIVRISHAIFVVIAFVTGVAAFIRLRTLGIAVLLSTVVYSALLHAVFVAKPRYNLPVLPLLVVAGCAGAALLWREWRAAQTSPRA